MTLIFLLAAHAAEPSATGDLFVVSDQPGARIVLDGSETTQVTPAMLRGVAVGAHVVKVRTACSFGEATVQVTAGGIARAELAMSVAPGSAAVTGTPVGAIVRVNGGQVGVVPWSASDLTCGEYAITVEAPDFLSFERRILVVAHETVGVQVDLVRAAYGTLVIDVSPLDARLHLDGQDLGSGPRTVDRVPVGHHTIEASTGALGKRSAEVDLTADETERVTLALTTNSGAMSRGSASAARIAGNGIVTAIGLGAAVASLVEYGAAREKYAEFLTVASDEEADRLYEEEVQPRQDIALGLAIGAGVSLVGAGVLWVTTDFASGATTVGVHGTF